MADINDIRIKFIVEDEQLRGLGELAEESAEDFRNGFTLFTQNTESTFFKFNKQVETSFKTFRSELDRVNATDSPFDTIFNPDANFFKSLKSTFKFFGADDLFNATFQGLGFVEDIIEPFRNESVIVDVPVELNPLINSSSSEPIEGGFLGLAKRAIENEAKKGRTIGELSEAFRNFLQAELTNEFAKFGDFEFPELKVNIPNLQLQVQNLDRQELLDQLDPTNLLELAVNASDEQLRAFLTLKLTIEDLNDQYERARDSLKVQAQATDDVTEKQENFNRVIGDTSTDTRRLTKQVKDTTDQIGDLNDETSDIDIEDKLSNIDVDSVDPKEIVPDQVIERTEAVGNGLTKSAEEGKKGLSSLGVFAGNIATNIAESFSGFISTAIKGDFDGIGDLWDDLLDAETEENQQNVIFLDEFREKGEEFRLAA